MLSRHQNVLSKLDTQDVVRPRSDFVASELTVSILSLLVLVCGCASTPSTPQESEQPIRHVESAFERLRQEELRRDQSSATSTSQPSEPSPKEALTQVPMPLVTEEDQYLVATGYGNLGKGPLTCQRVADTAARAELAKLIRVYVEEHTVDRLRERSGSPAQQDIEVVREEWAGELLQDVKIIDRLTDQAAGMCSSTAVMPKPPIQKEASRGKNAEPSAP